MVSFGAGLHSFECFLVNIYHDSLLHYFMQKLVYIMYRTSVLEIID